MSTRIFTMAAVAALLVVACDSTTADTTESQMTNEETPCPTEGQELETAMLYIEHNAADEDTGFHGNIGGEPWTRLCIRDPQGRTLLDVFPQGPLGELGLSDLFFESNEPPNDEYPIEELRSDLPEGEYEIAVVGEDGTNRIGIATFTHDIPQEPEITSPELAEDEDADDVPVVESSLLVVAWSPVTETIDGDSLSVSAYEVIVTKVEHEDPNGFSRPVYDVHLGPNTTSLSVPEEFLEADTLYELEVLAIETSGNQTIAAGFFATD